MPDSSFSLSGAILPSAPYLSLLPEKIATVKWASDIA
jgi:hypothetical protein